jgi:hypothetical protein
MFYVLTVDTNSLGEEIAQLAVHLEAAEYRLITKIGLFDAAEGWAKEGAVSCAHWLSWRIGLAPGAAREKVRVARALKALPKTSKSFEQGKLSYSKVRAMTRVATPENEELLIAIASEAIASDLERICSRFRNVLEREREPLTPEEAEERRYVKAGHTANGMMRVTIQLPVDEGARLLAAIDQARLAPEPADASAGTRPNRADGLMTIAESFLAEGPKARGGVACEVQLHVSKSDLETKGDGAFITNAGSAHVSAETARRLSCDAARVEVIEDDRGNVLDIGRRTRTVPAAIRRALHLRDQRKCTFPGCTHELFLDAHHIEHWIDGGKTSLDNLITLCRRHHTFVHEHGYAIRFDDSGRPSFSSPEGRVLPRAPSPPDAPSDPIQTLAEQHAAAGLDLEHVSLMPQHWNGEPTDFDEVVHALAIKTLGDLPHHAPTGARVSAEIDDGCALGLSDEAYDHWAIEWESEV